MDNLRTRNWVLLTASLLLAGLLINSVSAEEPAKYDIGRQVERKMSPGLAWITKEKIRAGYSYMAGLEFFPVVKDCGMNSIITRIELAVSEEHERGNKRHIASRELLAASGREAAKYGLHLFFMVDIASHSEIVQECFKDNPRRQGNGNGPSIIDPVYWERAIDQRFLRGMKILREAGCEPAGFLIDPEMYALAGAVPGGVDCGDYAFSEFVKERKLKLDCKSVPLKKREELLRNRGLWQAFEKFQFRRVEEMARRTREKLQVYNPDYIFGFFVYRDNLWFKAMAKGFSTERTPVFVGPESTYWGSFNDAFMAYQQMVRRSAGVPVLFVPGLAYGMQGNPLAPPWERLKVLPGNLYHKSINSQGYWFWTLGRIGSTLEEWRIFTEPLRKVNEELDRWIGSDGKYVSQLRPASLPAEAPHNLETVLVDARSWEPLPEKMLKTIITVQESRPAELRYLHGILVKAEKGETITFYLTSERYYSTGTSYTLYGPDGQKVMKGEVGFGRKETISHKAKTAGPYVLAATGNMNAYHVKVKGPNGVICQQEDKCIHICRTARPGHPMNFYFYVPRWTEVFSIKFFCPKREPATFRLYDGNGELVEEVVQLNKLWQKEISADGRDGQVWNLQLSDIDDDAFFSIAGIPGIFALHPTQLLVPKP